MHRDRRPYRSWWAAWVLCGISQVALAAGPGPTARDYLTIGNEAYGAGRAEAAIAAWSAAIEADPELVPAYYNRCVARSRTGAIRGALEDCTRAFMLDPSHARAYYVRGLIRSERLGDHAGSILDFDQAIRIRPGYGAAYMKRANARARTGDPRGAEQDYSQAIANGVADADAYFNRGVARFRQEAYDGALSDLRRAARLYGEEGRPERRQATLEAIRDLRQETRR